MAYKCENFIEIYIKTKKDAISALYILANPFYFRNHSFLQDLYSDFVIKVITFNGNKIKLEYMIEDMIDNNEFRGKHFAIQGKSLQHTKFCNLLCSSYHIFVNKSSLEKKMHAYMHKIIINRRQMIQAICIITIAQFQLKNTEHLYSEFVQKIRNLSEIEKNCLLKLLVQNVKISVENVIEIPTFIKNCVSFKYPSYDKILEFS